MSRKVTEQNETQPVDIAAEGVEPGVETREAIANAVAEATAPLQSEVDRLKQERDQSVERLARLQAEFENARKRDARERADFRDFAVSGAVEQFLPVLDNFHLALKSS